MRPTLLLLLVLVLTAVGCNGGTVDQHALDQDSAAIDSLACEGALLANQIADEASLSTFARVHAGELAVKASNFEDALSERPTTPGIERAVREEARHAGRVADLLDELEANASDSRVAGDVQKQLEREGGCA